MTTIGMKRFVNAFAKKYNRDVRSALFGMLQLANVTRANSLLTLKFAKVCQSGTRISANAYVQPGSKILAQTLNSVKSAVCVSTATATAFSMKNHAPANAIKPKMNVLQAPFSTKTAANASSNPVMMFWTAVLRGLTFTGTSTSASVTARSNSPVSCVQMDLCPTTIFAAATLLKKIKSLWDVRLPRRCAPITDLIMS